MKYEINNCLVESVINLANSFDESDESCFEEAAQLITELAGEFKSQNDIEDIERENHIQDLIDGIS